MSPVLKSDQDRPSGRFGICSTTHLDTDVVSNYTNSNRVEKADITSTRSPDPHITSHNSWQIPNTRCGGCHENYTCPDVHNHAECTWYSRRCSPSACALTPLYLDVLTAGFLYSFHGFRVESCQTTTIYHDQVFTKHSRDASCDDGANAFVLRILHAPLDATITIWDGT